MKLQDRLQQYAKQPNNADGREVTSQTVASIKKDFLSKVIGDKPYYDDEDAYADEKRAQHELIDKQIERLERYIGSTK